jgi:hypothetical protein
MEHAVIPHCRAHSVSTGAFDDLDPFPVIASTDRAIASAQTIKY